MVKEKKKDDESDELNDSHLALARILETQKTIRLIAIIVGVVLVCAIVTWGIVRIHTQDFWLEVIAFLIGPTGILTFVIQFMIWRLRRKLKTTEEEVKKAGPKSGETKKGDMP